MTLKLLLIVLCATITKHSGVVIENVSVTKVEGNLVHYHKSSSPVERVLSRLAVAKIEFDDGTVEEFEKPTGLVITEDKNDVAGLVYLDDVEALSLWGGISAQDLGRNKVDMKLRKRAKELGGCAVLAPSVTSSFGGASGTAKVYGIQLSYPAARNIAETYLLERRFLSSKIKSAKRDKNGDMRLEYKARNRGYPKFYKVRKARFVFEARDEGDFEVYFAGKDSDWVLAENWHK